MKNSKLHLRVIIAEIITIIGFIGVFACALLMLIKAGVAQDAANGTWQYYINQWFNSVQAKAGFDVLTLVFSLVGTLVGFVFGILSMIFGIKARRYVGIWYFFQMDTVGGAAGLGLSLIFPMLKIMDLNIGFNYYGALLFAFIGGILLIIFLFIQFVLFMKECHLIIKERNENVETKEDNEVLTNEETTTIDSEVVTSTNNDKPVAVPTDDKEENIKNVEPTKNDIVEEKPVEKKPTTSTKKDTNVAKKTSQNSKKETKKSTPNNTKVEDKKVDDKVTNDKTPVKSSGKVYHISQHPTSNKWQVKLAKGEKALKLFDTQAEAINYAKEVASNQGGSIRVHSREGKIRKA